MGRKIKGRKHRGIRDPEKQRQTKLLSLRDKINSAPSNPDDQQIPKSLSHIINLKERVQSGIITAKRKRKNKLKRALRPVTSHPQGITNTGVGKDVPFFQQEEGESDRKFMVRVNQICKSVIDEAAFANKYGVDIIRNLETGQVENVIKRRKDELELYIKQIKKEKKLKGKKKLKNNIQEPALTKSQKRQLKLKQKKENRLVSSTSELEMVGDNVKFGEVAHEPPTLSAPRKVKLEETPRPGKKNLLLKSLIDPNKKDEEARIVKKEDQIRKVSNKVINKKGKRKDLPHALRRQLEKQQQEVIEAYKKLKAKRNNMK